MIFTNRVSLMIGAAILLAAIAWYAKAATERAALAEAQADALTGALDRLGEMYRERQQHLAERQQALAAADQRAATWRRRWKDAQKQPDVQKWSGTAMPGPVVARMRELSAGGTGGASGADSSAGTDSGP